MVKRHYGIRTERYKLIHFYNDINWWELYDMQADPTEMHNLYEQPEYEPVVKELKEEMLKLQEQYNDPVRFSPKETRNNPEINHDKIYLHTVDRISGINSDRM